MAVQSHVSQLSLLHVPVASPPPARCRPIVFHLPNMTRMRADSHSADFISCAPTLLVILTLFGQHSLRIIPFATLPTSNRKPVSVHERSIFISVHLLRVVSACLLVPLCPSGCCVSRQILSCADNTPLTLVISLASRKPLSQKNVNRNRKSSRR